MKIGEITLRYFFLIYTSFAAAAVVMGGMGLIGLLAPRGTPELRIMSVILLFILAGLFYRLLQMKKNPTLIEIFYHGLWFAKEQVFMPFEGLLAMEIRRRTSAFEQNRFFKEARFIFDASGTPDSQTRVTLTIFSHPYILGVSFEDMFHEIQEAAEQHNQGLNFPTPVINLENEIV